MTLPFVSQQEDTDRFAYDNTIITGKKQEKEKIVLKTLKPGCWKRRFSFLYCDKKE